MTQRKISQREVFIQCNVVTEVYNMQVEEYTESMAFIHRVDQMHLELINWLGLWKMFDWSIPWTDIGKDSLCGIPYTWFPYLGKSHKCLVQ